MPPVFGPASPSPTRLKSCAGISGTTSSPSQMQNSDTSGPERNSSTTTAPSGLARQAWACSSASARSSVTTTPLPAASPSSLTTCGAPRASSASSTSATVVQTWASPVGTSAADMTSLAKALLPSSRAASRRRAEARDAGVTHRVGHARHQRRLRPDDDEVDPHRDRQRDDPGRVAHPTGQRLAAGHGLDAGVARCGDHGVDRRVERDGTDEGVLAGPGPDDEYLHATNLVAGAGERYGRPGIRAGVFSDRAEPARARD